MTLRRPLLCSLILLCVSPQRWLNAVGPKQKIKYHYLIHWASLVIRIIGTERFLRSVPPSQYLHKRAVDRTLAQPRVKLTFFRSNSIFKTWSSEHHIIHGAFLWSNSFCVFSFIGSFPSFILDFKIFFLCLTWIYITGEQGGCRRGILRKRTVCQVLVHEIRIHKWRMPHFCCIWSLPTTSWYLWMRSSRVIRASDCTDKKIPQI